MDTLRGNFDSSDVTDDSRDYDVTDEESGRDVPPPSIGQDERRMQVRAYNFWAGMLDDRAYPSIEELDPASNEDFGPYGVLLDFSVGIEDPAVQFLGGELAKECGTDDEIRKLSDVPPRSLLSRITDHYMQILANQAPIGFEAEFVNQRGNTVLYRGILLPFSSDGETIDFIYGVINWKEMAEAAQADELLLEIDQALETGAASIEEDAHEEEVAVAETPVADWADGPGADDGVLELGEAFAAEPEDETFEAEPDAVFDGGNIQPLDLADLDFDEDADLDPSSGLPRPAFGDYDLGYDEDEEEGEEEDEANYDFASLTDHIKAPTKKALSLDLDIHDLEEEGANGGDSPAIPTAYEPEAFEPGADEFAGEGQPVAEPVEEPLELAFELPPVSAEEVYEELAEREAEETAEAVEKPVETAEVAADTPEVIDLAPTSFADFDDDREDIAVDEVEAAAELGDDAGLYDYLASARELALTARSKEDRSRQALYAAVGRAYDFSIAAQESPAEYEELVSENGLTVQDRAPMTPVVKLVFGADYDKTRLTEYAAVLSHAHRVGVERGTLSRFLTEAEGGLKGVVQAERRLRREEAGETVDPVGAMRAALAKKLRALETMSFDDIDVEGAEFSVVMLHRTADGELVVLGEVDDDMPLIERVGRKLVA